MSLGPHFSAASGSPTAMETDFAAMPFPNTSGSGPRVLAASSPANDVASEPSAERDGFADRRRSGGNRGGSERRQFGSSHAGLSPDAKELAVAIDQYKLAFRRRYITCEEMLAVITQLGYRRVDQP